MLIPVAQQTIQLAYEQMLSHQQFDLMPVYRKMIYDSLNASEFVTGRGFKAWLGILAVKQVLPIWYRAWPDNNLVEHLLQKAQNVLSNPVSLEESEEMLNAAWKQIFERTSDPQGLSDEAAGSVGLAAYTALEAAVGIDSWEDVEFNDSDNNDLDIWHTDTANCAADAYSEPIWSDSFDAKRRQAFWEWWLKEAIPQAWELASKE